MDSMKTISQHFTKCLIAGIVAILPIGGLIITVGYLETTISSSGLSKLPFYFPGMGILMIVVGIYIVGLTVTTFVGRWAWKRIDAVINSLPALGKIYLSIKEILGYGEGEDAMFQDTVLVPLQNGNGKEIGLITNTVALPDGAEQLIIFVPGSPNPTIGRLIISDEAHVTRVSLPTNEALKAMVTVGKMDINLY
jgi:uncharacterized membrane protein